MFAHSRRERRFHHAQVSVHHECRLAALQSQGFDEFPAETIRPATTCKRHHPEQRACFAQLTAEVMFHSQLARLLRDLERFIELALIPLKQPARQESLRPLSWTRRPRPSDSDCLLEQRDG